MTEISGNIEIASDYSSFKSIIDSTAIKRIEQLQSLNFYLSENQVVYLAGPKSMGKTTLLSQFLDNNQRHSIAIFLNEGNSISLVDNDIYKDIYLQIRIYTNEFTRKDLEKDISLNDLRIIFKNLSYYLRGSNKQMFFILDGFENLSGNEIKSLEELLYNLPHAPEVKFIVSVISDEKLKQKILVKNSTTFNIPLLTEGQVQLILPEASHEQIKLILQSFHGKPDCISIIARLNKQNVTIDEILQNPSQETNALYAAEWDVTIINDEQSTLVGFLAFSNQTVRIDDICIHCDKSKNEMIEIIESISFIQITDNLIDFVSFGHKKFTKDKLKKDKSKFLNNIINSIKTKKIPSSQTNLSLYLKEVGDNKEVIEHINNKFLLDIFNNTHSINELQKNVSIALDASIEVDNNPKAIKYRHIKCAFSNISTSDLLVNELKCYLTDKDLTSAVTLIESSNSNEGKLQLYCIYCIHFKDQKLEVENDIKVKIDYLFSQININDLGDEKTLDIASDLFPVFPEKAMKLINELDSNNSSGQNKSDNAFLKLSLETLKRHGNSFSDDLDEFTGLKDKKSEMFSALKIFNPDSPINIVIEYIDKMPEVGDRIFLLRAWLSQHHTNKNSILLLEKVIDLIISTTTFSSDASLYYDISRCLTNGFNSDSDISIKKTCYDRLATQLISIKKKGPTIKYCQLELLINKFEIMNNIESERIQDLTSYVMGVQDKSISLACLSIITKFTKDESITPYDIDIKSEKSKLVENLLISDAYHLDVFKEAIKFEAKNDLSTALYWSGKLNTEPRRDKATAIAISSYCSDMNQKNMPVTIYKLLEHFSLIKDEYFKAPVYEALVDNIHKLDLSKNAFKDIFKTINRIENRKLRAKYLADVTVISINKEVYNELSEDKILKIKESINLIDGIWNQIDTSFYIYSKLLKFDKKAAITFKEQAIELRNNNPIHNQNVVEYLVSSISLAIRNLYFLAEHNLDQEDNFDLIISYIEKIPSNVMQTKLFSRLASAYQKNSKIEKTKIIIENHLIPLLKYPTGQVSTEYNHCLAAALPILALYKTSLFM